MITPIDTKEIPTVDECKRDFFENIAFQTVVKVYRAYHYTPESNKRFAEELEQYLASRNSLEAER